MFKTFILATIAAAASATSNLEQLLAQLGSETESAKHTCLSVANRDKAALDDFYKILSSKKAYTDKDFTADQSAVYWSDIDTIAANESALKTKV